MLLHALQRGSVILADGVLVSAAWYATRRFGEPQRSAAFLLIVANAGLLLVDHIHFQYNGLLLGVPRCKVFVFSGTLPFPAMALAAGTSLGIAVLQVVGCSCLLTPEVVVVGILLWSIVCIEEGLDVLAAALFALLLNMKHLLACLTPLYLVYLLRHYCR